MLFLSLSQNHVLCQSQWRWCLVPQLKDHGLLQRSKWKNSSLMPGMLLSDLLCRYKTQFSLFHVLFCFVLLNWFLVIVPDVDSNLICEMIWCLLLIWWGDPVICLCTLRPVISCLQAQVGPAEMFMAHNLTSDGTFKTITSCLCPPLSQLCYSQVLRFSSALPS